MHRVLPYAYVSPSKPHPLSGGDFLSHRFLLCEQKHLDLSEGLAASVLRGKTATLPLIRSSVVVVVMPSAHFYGPRPYAAARATPTQIG